VFLFLEGDNTNLTVPEDRQHWGTGTERHGVRDWAKREGLQVIGANYFVEKNQKQ
jgi:phosphatidylethanolamine-binding protein